MKILSLVVFAVSRHKGVLGIIEIIEYAAVQRKSGTQDGGYHDIVIVGGDVRYSQRSDKRLFRMLQRHAYLIGEYFAEPFQVSSETHAVLLDFPVTHLRDEFVEN